MRFFPTLLYGGKCHKFKIRRWRKKSTNLPIKRIKKGIQRMFRFEKNMIPNKSDLSTWKLDYKIQTFFILVQIWFGKLKEEHCTHKINERYWRERDRRWVNRRFHRGDRSDFHCVGKTFSIKIMPAVVITMLLNSANQNLLEISHLNYGRWCIPLKRVTEIIFNFHHNLC